MSAVVSFVVLGSPVPKARARAYRDKRTGAVRHVTPEKTRGYEALVRGVAWAAVLEAKRRGNGWPLDARYKLTVRAYRSADAGDLDNIIKSIKDGCNGVVWNDDRQVTHLGECFRAVDRKRPRAEVVVEVVS